MIRNRLIMLLWWVLALFGVPRRQISANSAVNRAVLEKAEFWRAGEYIENQAQWGEVRFGRRYDMAYGGCGILAVCNALTALGEPVGAEDVVLLMEHFQRRGVAFGGKFGLFPRAIGKFLKKRGWKVLSTATTDPASIDRLGSRGKVFIVTACNSKSLRDQIHTVCITKEGQNRYTVHNGYHMVKLADGRKAYCANGPFDTLSEAVRHISSKGAVPVLVLGITG